MQHTSTSAGTHVVVGFDNPYLVCAKCKARAIYWHDPVRCKCEDNIFNHPCYCEAGTISLCPTWQPIEGCCCENKETHDV